MDEQRSWQERWGVADLETRHWVGLVGLAFVALSPFLALGQPVAGLLGFVVGMLLFAIAAADAPDENTDNE